MQVNQFACWIFSSMVLLLASTPTRAATTAFVAQTRQHIVDRYLFIGSRQSLSPYSACWMSGGSSSIDGGNGSGNSTDKASQEYNDEKKSGDTAVKKIRRKHKIRWKTPAAGDSINEDDSDAVVFDAYDGETLRTAALRRGVVSPHNGRSRLINCRGLGTCGTCAVEIVSVSNNNGDAIQPPTRSPTEQLRLNFPPHNGSNNPNLRLACQVQIRGDVVVTKRTGFWGQHYDTMAKPSVAQTYFRELEFVLDIKSPPDATGEEDDSSTSNNS